MTGVGTKPRRRVVVAAMMVWACGGETTGPDPDPDPVTIQSVTVTPAADTVKIGLSITLQAEVKDAAGTVVAQTVSWTSSNANATVSPAGVVTGAGLGNAVITASAGGRSGQATVVILGPPVTLELSIGDTVIRPGDSLLVSGTAYDGLGRTLADPVTFTSLSPGALSVTGGVVRAVGPGAGRLRAQAGTVTLEVEVGVLGHPAGNVVGTPDVFQMPYGIAVSRSGLVYVTQLSGTTVAWDSIGGGMTFGSSIAVGGTPTSVAFSGDGSRAYTANQDGRVAVVNVATRVRIDTVRVQGAPFIVSVDASGTLWVGSNQAWVYRINPMTLGKQDSVNVGGYVNAIAFGAGRVWVTDPSGGTVTSLDPDNLASNTVYAIGGDPQGLAVWNDTLYVAREAGNLLRMSAVSGAVLDSLAVPNGFGVAVSPDGARLYVARKTAGLSIVDLTTGGITTLTPGGDLRRVAFERLGSTAVVSDQNGRVIVIQ